MNQILEKVIKSQTARRRPKINPGDIVRVHHKVMEAKTEKGKGGEKSQVFEGIVLRAKNLSTSNGTFMVRKVSFGVGVEKIFPFYSPIISKIEVVKKSKIRRAKLYYLRELSGKKARMKEKEFDKKTLKMLGWEDQPQEQPEDKTETEEVEEKTKQQNQAKPNKKAEEKKENQDEKTDKEDQPKAGPPGAGEPKE